MLKQFHVLSGFDYRRCAVLEACGLRFHRRFADLAARQPWACGALCHQAAAFARLAEALGQGSDGLWLVAEAQAELLPLEAMLSTRPELSCGLLRSFPVFDLLARMDGIVIQRPLPKEIRKTPNQPPPPTLAKLCDLIASPPQQRLTQQGALALYFLLRSVGALLDHFQVTWWMSSGGLLGTLRNQGLLLQDCDVDIALWRPHIAPLVSPSFKAALAAAGIAMFHMPIYFQYRFCLQHVPAAADARASHGLACHLPYVDAHLADHAEPTLWRYIHRTELVYAQSFALSGRLRDLFFFLPKTLKDVQKSYENS